MPGRDRRRSSLCRYGAFREVPHQAGLFALVLPSLLLNYFGQGALLLINPAAVKNSFYLLAPSWGLFPLIILATVATVVASQAVVSGAFSLTFQALQLDLLPRVKGYTHLLRGGGADICAVCELTMLLGTIFLSSGFRSSSNLAGESDGVAIATLMIITTLLMHACSVSLWNWSALTAFALTAGLLIVDAAFFGANIVKIDRGGRFPFVIAIAVYIVIGTWSRGRELLRERFSGEEIPFDMFLTDPNLKSVPRSRREPPFT